MIVSLISFASAIDITAGEPYTFSVEEEYDYYSIVGNSTTIDLEINQSGNNITIITDKYLSNETFTLVFFNKEKEIIYSYSGGGGSRTIYKDRNVTQYVDKIIEVPYNDTTISDDDLIIAPKGSEDKGFFLWRFFRWLWNLFF